MNPAPTKLRIRGTGDTRTVEYQDPAGAWKLLGQVHRQERSEVHATVHVGRSATFRKKVYVRWVATWDLPVGTEPPVLWNDGPNYPPRRMVMDHLKDWSDPKRWFTDAAPPSNPWRP